jgi:hypothetical protein
VQQGNHHNFKRRRRDLQTTVDQQGNHDFKRRRRSLQAAVNILADAGGYSVLKYYPLADNGYVMASDSGQEAEKPMTGPLSGSGASETQQWKFEEFVHSNGNTYYKIRLRATNLCLRFYDGYIQFGACGDGNHQIWWLQEVAGQTNHFALTCAANGNHVYRDVNDPSGDLILKSGSTSARQSDQGYWFEIAAVPAPVSGNLTIQRIVEPRNDSSLRTGRLVVVVVE